MARWRDITRKYADEVLASLNKAREWATTREGLPPPPPCPAAHWTTEGVWLDQRRCRKTNARLTELFESGMRQWGEIVRR